MPTKTFCQAMEAETKRAKKSAEKQYGKLLEVAWPRIYSLGLDSYIGDNGKENGNYYTVLYGKLLEVAWPRI